MYMRIRVLKGSAFLRRKHGVMGTAEPTRKGRSGFVSSLQTPQSLECSHGDSEASRETLMLVTWTVLVEVKDVPLSTSCRIKRTLKSLPKGEQLLVPSLFLV
ncbi:hypothetical protein V6N13_129608 [Hibiscus sabdariffa]